MVTTLLDFTDFVASCAFQKNERLTQRMLLLDLVQLLLLFCSLLYVTKSTGSSNPHNMIKATFDALQSTMSPRIVASKRGKKVSDIVGRRRGAEQTSSQSS